MFELIPGRDYAQFRRIGDAADHDIPVFLIDDDWESASRLAEAEGALAHNHARIKTFLRKTLRPDAVTMRAPWAFCTHPRISRVYLGPFLTVEENWVAALLKTHPSEHRGLFFVDHQDRKQGERNSAYDSIKLLIEADVSPSRIYSYTISPFRDILNHIDTDFGVRKDQILIKASLDDQPVEEMDKIIQAAACKLNYVPFLTSLKRVPGKGPVKDTAQLKALAGLAAADPKGIFAWAAEHASSSDFPSYFSALRAFVHVSHQPTSPIGEHGALVGLAAVGRRRAGVELNDECSAEEIEFWQHAKGRHFRAASRRSIADVFDAIQTTLTHAGTNLRSIHVSAAALEPRLVLDFADGAIATLGDSLHELEVTCGGLTKGRQPNIVLLTFPSVEPQDLARERMRRSVS